MKRYVFQYKIIRIATLFILHIISIAQNLHPRVNMIQDIKNDFKNDLCIYKHSDNNNNNNKMIIYCIRNILNTS